VQQTLFEGLPALPRAGQFCHAPSDLACHHYLDETLFGFEAAEHGHTGDAGSARDIVHRGPADAELGELGQCGRRHTIDHLVGSGLGTGAYGFGY
jgi:hypothetical protein